MCWINWFVWLNTETVLKKMNSSIKHRGPDDEGTFFDEKNNVWLGHVRLAILDLTDAGHQPMFYDKKTGASSEKFQKENILHSKLSIVYNWEIYNYKEIKDELEKLWYKFSTKTDTEVILASYQQWWENCVNKFNWMWAFCIFDRQKNILFCSRDRMWKKPFYYCL